ncbi:MAG: DUF4340 domain-containing protein [Desulfamplus sp.]|nr:DUF4340 domain-containing protein [Desulfamplus sp.]
MKKEYIILGLIIIALSAYLITNKTDRDNYSLPSVPEINVADIVEVNLDKDGKSIVLSKKDGSWVVGSSVDKSYPADQESITKMLDIVKALKLSALVSESGNLTPYELDAKNKINVTVKSKTATVRKFEIGKTAPSFRHTFVKLDGSKSVYHAEKSFRRDFEKTVDDLRDKKVLSFDKNKITNITLKKGDIVKEVAIKDGKPVEKKEEKAQDSNKDEKTAENKAAKSDENKSGENKFDDNKADNLAINKENEAVEGILTILSDLKCHSFTDTENKNEFKDKGVEEIAKVTLKADANKELSFVIYKKDEKENYPAISSENVYPFLLTTYEGNDIISKIDDAMGLKKEDSKINDAMGLKKEDNKNPSETNLDSKTEKR